jgi:tRNA(Ile)-lysidine synthase
VKRSEDHRVRPKAGHRIPNAELLPDGAPGSCGKRIPSVCLGRNLACRRRDPFDPLSVRASFPGMQPLSDLARSVGDFAQAHDLLPVESTVVVAVSGGPDSVALLHVLRELAPHNGLSLVVAHFQHHLRDAESLQDEVFVEDLCRDLGVPYERGEAAPRGGGSIEAQARTARYRFLEEIRLKRDADRVALGHTADDQVETVLLHLGRGAGIRGVSGMPLKRGSLIRPLLSVWRREIQHYLQGQGHAYRVDSSNLAAASDRNRVRLGLLPAWQLAFGEWVFRAVLRTAGNLREVRGYIECELQRMRDVVCSQKEGLTTLDISALRQYHTYLRRELLLRLVEEAGAPGREVGTEGVERLLALCGEERGKATAVIAGGVSVVRRGHRLYLGTQGHARTGPFCFRLSVPGNLSVPHVGLAIRAWAMSERPAWFPGDGVRRVCVPRASLAHSDWVVVRNRRPSDRIRVRRDVRKRVKKLLQEGGVVPWMRSATVVVADGRELLWVVGLRRAWVERDSPAGGGYVGFEVHQRREHER